MKKARFLSLLLTAALVTSSLPTAAAASAPQANGSAADITVGTDLLPQAQVSYSTSGTIVNVKDGNGYLHFYDRVKEAIDGGASGNLISITSGVGYRHTVQVEKGVIYYASFDLRTSVESISSSDTKADDSAISADEAVMYHVFDTNFDTEKILVQQWGSSFDASVPTPTNQIASDTGYTFKHTSNTGVVSYAGAGYYNLRPNENWQTYEFAFIPAANKTDPQFCIYRGGYHYRSVPIDIDNFKIWYYEDGSDTPTYLINERGWLIKGG